MTSLGSGIDKHCKTCDTTKPITEFHRDGRSPGGRKSRCKVCRHREETSKRYVSHKHVYSQAKKVWATENRDRLRTRAQQRRAAKREMMGPRKRSQREKDTRNQYERDRRRRDPLYRFRQYFRTSVKNYAKKHEGYLLNEVSTYIGMGYEELFNMLTDNGAVPMQGRHVDHICPLSQAKTVEELKKLQHYSNLRLITSEENKKKSDSRTPEGESLCRTLLGRDWL